MTISKALSAGLIDGTGAITPANVTVSTNNLTVGSSLYVVANGNIGVGTTNPKTSLQVAGGALIQGSANNTETDPVYGGTWFAFDGSNNLAVLQAINPSTAGFSFHTKTGAGSAPSQSMRLTAGSYLGVGVSGDPSYPLQVRRGGGSGSLGVNVDNPLGISDRTVKYHAVGDSNTDITNHAFYVRNATSTDNLSMIMRYDGTVGVGTLNPTHPFHVYTTGGGAIAAFQASAANGHYTTWLNGSTVTGYVGTANRVAAGSNTDFGIGTPGNTGVFISTNNSVKFSIDGSGRVTTPSMRLDSRVGIDTTIYWSQQKFIENGDHGMNLFGGSTLPTYVTNNNTSTPFGKVLSYAGYAEGNTDEFIPVQPGEIIYGEIWAFRANGATGTAGNLYAGIARYDKDKNPIAGNSGLDYFIATSATVPTTGVWTKYSGSTTIPTSHTPYNGSDGGPCRYIKPYVIVNYSSGTITTLTSGFMIRKSSLVRDSNVIVDGSGRVGIGTTSPTSKLHVSTGTTGGFALFQGSARTMYLEDDGASSRISTEGTGPFSIRAASSGGSHLTIDTSGRITNSSQPYGSVSWTGTLLRGNVIPFATVNQERVALWNTSTYRFTAPVTGYYLFTCIGKTAGTGGLDFNIQLLHNGSTVVESWGYDTSGGKAYGVSLSHIRALSASDYVQFYFNHDSASPAALSAAWASYALLG